MSSWEGRIKARRYLRLQCPTWALASHSTTSPQGAGENVGLRPQPWVGRTWGSAPSLGCSGQHVHFGMNFVTSKGFPEILRWMFIPWQTGLAAVQPVCF